MTMERLEKMYQELEDLIRPYLEIFQIKKEPGTYIIPVMRVGEKPTDWWIFQVDLKKKKMKAVGNLLRLRLFFPIEKVGEYIKKIDKEIYRILQSYGGERVSPSSSESPEADRFLEE